MKKTTKPKRRMLKAGDIRPPGYQWRERGSDTFRGEWHYSDPHLTGEPIYAESLKHTEFRAPAKPATP